MEVLKRVGDTFYLLMPLEEFANKSVSLSGVSSEIDEFLNKGYRPLTTIMGFSGENVLFITTFIDKENSFYGEPDILETILLYCAGEDLPYKTREEIPIFVDTKEMMDVGGVSFSVYKNAKVYEINVPKKTVDKLVSDFVYIFKSFPIVLLVDEEDIKRSEEV